MKATKTGMRRISGTKNAREQLSLALCDKAPHRALLVKSASEEEMGFYSV